MTKYTVEQVFTNDEKKLLETYLIKSSKMHYCRHTNKTKSRQARIYWLKGFMNFPFLTRENPSLSRSTSLNKHNVNQFFDNYEKVLKKCKFTRDGIYNFDESNIMTVV